MRSGGAVEAGKAVAAGISEGGRVSDTAEPEGIAAIPYMIYEVEYR